MSLNLDVLIKSPEYEVDMKAGLDTLQGASEVTRIISETLLTDHIPERKSHKSNVRTILKKSFKGSYGQTFRLEILDEKLIQQYRKIGSTTFSELISYFLKESLYLETEELSDKAQKIIDRLGEKPEALIKQLQKSPMRNLHEISKKFGYEVELRHRKSIDNKIPLIKVNPSTLQAILAKTTNEKLSIKASIRRFNTNTGNGRLQILGEDRTVAFGFKQRYADVDFEIKKLISENLDINNGIDSEHWKYLDIATNPVRLPDKSVVKYIVRGIHE